MRTRLRPSAEDEFPTASVLCVRVRRAWVRERYMGRLPVKLTLQDEGVRHPRREVTERAMLCVNGVPEDSPAVKVETLTNRDY